MPDEENAPVTEVAAEAQANETVTDTISTVNTEAGEAGEIAEEAVAESTPETGADSPNA